MNEPSPWILRFAHLLNSGANVLDLACGKGRHTRYFAGRGCKVSAVDIDIEAVKGLAGVTAIEADLERGGWPLARQQFDAVIVTNYLCRPILPDIIAATGPQGILLYETFGRGNEKFGKPSSPDFLLKPGELLDAVHGKLQIVAYEHGQVTHPKAAVIQRICAVNSNKTVKIRGGYDGLG